MYAEEEISQKQNGYNGETKQSLLNTHSHI